MNFCACCVFKRQTEHLPVFLKQQDALIDPVKYEMELLLIVAIIIAILIIQVKL